MRFIGFLPVQERLLVVYEPTDINKGYSPTGYMPLTREDLQIIIDNNQYTSQESSGLVGKIKKESK